VVNVQLRNSLLSPRLSDPKKEAIMNDLEKYIEKRKKKDSEFAQGFEEGYKEFKIGNGKRDALQ